MKHILIAITLTLGLLSCKKIELKPTETGVRILVHGFIDSPEYRPTPEFSGTADLIITSPYSRTALMQKGETINITTSYRPVPNSNPNIERSHKVTVYVDGSVYEVVEIGADIFDYTYTQPF